MPIARREYRQRVRGECRNIAVERRDDGVALRHSEAAAGQKIVLHIDRDQRIAGLQTDGGTGIHVAHGREWKRYFSAPQEIVGLRRGRDIDIGQ